MKEIKNDIIKKYSYKNYVIYIKDCENSYNCYLQHEYYGIIMLMYGLSKEDVNLKQFVDTIEDNIQQYIELYKNDYLDDIFIDTFNC